MTDANPSQSDLGQLILDLLSAAGAARVISPDAAARAAGGDPAVTERWRPLLRAVRDAAALLQDQGRLVVLRKGRPADIRTAKGVIRLALPRGD